MKRLVFDHHDARFCIDSALDILRGGGVVVAPTDTVYGLLADISNKEALKRIFGIKGRSPGNPLPVFIASFDRADGIMSISDERVKKLLNKLWPGKATCLLPARGWLPKDVLSIPRGGLFYAPRGMRVGVRVPGHPFLRGLLAAYENPLTGTSANLSGRDPYIKISELINDFEKMPFKPDLIIDAGNLPESLPSTVIDCTVWPPEIIREGAVSAVELGNCLY